MLLCCSSEKVDEIFKYCTFRLLLRQNQGYHEPHLPHKKSSSGSTVIKQKANSFQESYQNIASFD